MERPQSGSKRGRNDDADDATRIQKKEIAKAMCHGACHPQPQDEEDEELLRKAKENRAERIKEQQQTTRTFMQQEGLANQKLNQDAIPVQKAVFKVCATQEEWGAHECISVHVAVYLIASPRADMQLAESGKELEKGNTKGAAQILSEDWVDDFKASSVRVGAIFCCILRVCRTDGRSQTNTVLYVLHVFYSSLRRWTLWRAHLAA
jgi:hypothetical protein